MKLTPEQKEQFKSIVYEEYVINKLSIDKIKEAHPEIKNIEKILKDNNIKRIKPLKEDIYNYYIIENHTLDECKVKFKCDIPYLLKYYNISKKDAHFVSKEDLYNYYVVENHSYKECEDHFNIKDANWLCYKYGISKGSKKTSLKIKEAWGKLNLEEYSSYQKDRWASYSKEERENITLRQCNSWKSKKDEDIKEITSKRTNTRYLNNGGFYQSWMEDYSPLFKKCLKDIDYFRQFMKDNPNLNRDDLCKLFNCNFNVVQNFIQTNQLQDYVSPIVSNIHISKKEKEVFSFIKKLGLNDVQSTNRSKLGNNLEMDIYIPSKNVGIEFNGTYWHSSLNLDKNYHLNKSKLAQEKGIRLIHIWEYEWNDPIQQEKIKSLLKIALGLTDNKIYARNCIIRQISNAEAKPFNDKNHLQGHRNAQVTYGLFYKGELVQLMSFSKTRYNRNLKNENEWEIIRGCPGSNNVVVGGVSKLFKHFIKDYNPSKVFSYCDFNKFDGKGYEAIGMKFIGYTGPDMKYWLKNGMVVNRNPIKYKYNKENCLARLYGAGSKKYEWRGDLQL